MKIQIPEYASATAEKTGGTEKRNALLYMEFLCKLHFMFGSESDSDFLNLIIRESSTFTFSYFSTLEE